MTRQLEQRSAAAELRIAEADSRRLVGLAVVYDVEADIGPFREIIRPGAFRDSLATDRNIRALDHHDGRRLLASTAARSLEMRDTPGGVEVEINVARTSAGDDVLALVEAGEVRGMSFGFTIPRGGDSFTRPEGSSKPLREIRQANLIEVTTTAIPAYAETTLARRDIDQAALEAAERVAALPDLRQQRETYRRTLAAQ